MAASGVVGKADRVLGAFEFDDTRLGLSELTRRTGLPKATVHRLATDLVRTGLLERSEDGYRLGVRLFELGQRVPWQRSLRDAALPFMEDLFVATRETVHLGVMTEGEVMYLEKLAGHRPVSAPSRIAGRMPLHCTATGKALLAFASETERDAVLARALRRRTPHTITDANVLRRQLEEIRVIGIAVESEETRLGYASVAAPFFGPGRRLLGALSVTAAMGRVVPEALGPIVRTATRGLTRSLRGTSAPTP